MFQRSSLLLISTFVILFSACKKEDDLFVIQPPDDGTVTNDETIDPVFANYVQRFVEEGAKRGFTIDLASKNITIQFTNINQQQSPNVVGMCSYDGHIHNDITIDLAFWQKAGDLQKEFILFHELGHCYLYREHRNGAFQNGLCLSIMRGADPGCVDAYTTANQDYYMDELFSIKNDMAS